MPDFNTAVSLISGILPVLGCDQHRVPGWEVSVVRVELNSKALDLEPSVECWVPTADFPSLRLGKLLRSFESREHTADLVSQYGYSQGLQAKSLP